MTIQAIKYKVIIKPDEKQTETESGLYLGDTNLEGALRRGTIISCGNLVRDGLKAGDKVCFLVGSGIAVEFEGEKYINMYDTEVVAKVEEV